MKLAAARVALGALLLAACSDGSSVWDPDYRPSGEVRQLTVEERALVAANTGFGLELLQHVAAGESGNVLVSPLSVSMALGMALNGAGGETWEEMRATLGFAGLDETQINEGYRGLLNQVRLRDPAVTIGVANSIWHDQLFNLEPLFIEQSETYFDAEVAALDFASASAPDAINGWVSDATGGRIRKLIESISPDEVAFLVNAVYFKATWSTRFDPGDTRSGSFRRADGSTVTAQFMSRDGSIALAGGADVQVAELPYQDSAFSMVLAMPLAGTVDEYVATLTAAGWDALLAELHPRETTLRMPKFTFAMKAELSGALGAMGMPTAFTDAADLSRLSPDPLGLYISRVQHETWIKVDEAGTEAAAATGVGVGVTSLPPTTTFDRPFLAAIRERDTGTILFIGIVRDPTAE
jgi:serpin B